MRIGVDLGGTKIEAVALDGAGGELARVRVPTPRHDYRGTIEAVASLVSTIERSTASRGSVGIGIPGTISPVTGLVKNANSTWLNGQHLSEDLSAVLGRPVRLANDANCFALSEAIDGAGAGADVVFGVILGTGCGGGIVVRRQVLVGPNAIAGEWGHNPLPGPREGEWPGPECYCGKTGCLEVFLSGPALARDYAEKGGDAELDAEAIVSRADHDPAAAAALARHEERLARALSALMNILDPDVIVLGGGLSNVERLYTSVPELWNTFGSPPETPRTRLLRAVHGDSSGVRGAAWLWNG
ncbi:fructokinase [soil metagenome]